MPLDEQRAETAEQRGDQQGYEQRDVHLRDDDPDADLPVFSTMKTIARIRRIAPETWRGVGRQGLCGGGGSLGGGGYGAFMVISVSCRGCVSLLTRLSCWV